MRKLAWQQETPAFAGVTPFYGQVSNLCESLAISGFCDEKKIIDAAGRYDSCM